MSENLFILVILIPIIGGALFPFLKFKKPWQQQIYLETIVCVTSVLVWSLLLNRPEESLILVSYTRNLTVAFRLDGLGMVFAGLISALWPFATLYAFEYMKKEGHKRVFFFFYTATYGVTLGIALSGNLLTMYLFYELLTLVTLPLVMHSLSREAILASRKYLYYSLGGAAFGFIGLIFTNVYSNVTQFALGGILDMGLIGDRTNTLLLVYVFAFLGFGVKAAIFPFNSWLPQAGVAPTPVTALLHAVAVVKSGAFAIMRITYYCFGTEFLKGTWAQNVVMAVVIFTIVYGCSRAVKETHLKRRLAYSTISNLSYILFGVVIMTPLGLIGALSHMIFHAVMKITSFFCAGAIMHQTEYHYVHELNGLGKKMPKTFGIFTISAFALMGVPGLAGFISKWNLAMAAVDSENTMAYVGIGALLISALLTAIYMLTIVVRAFFPANDFSEAKVKNVTDPNWYMMVPLYIFTVAIVYFGLFSSDIVAFFTKVAEGVI